MDIGKAAFVSLYLPLVTVAALVSFLLVRDVLLPAYRRKELSLRHHGLPASIALAFGVDAVENVYYSIARFWPVMEPVIRGNYPALSVLRIIVMLAGVLALLTYARMADWPMRTWQLLLGLFGMWGCMFVFLITR
jgi:hypothetical protein